VNSAIQRTRQSEDRRQQPFLYNPDTSVFTVGCENGAGALNLLRQRQVSCIPRFPVRENRPLDENARCDGKIGLSVV